MNKYLDLLYNKAKEFNITLSKHQLGQFEQYWQYLNEYNKHTNLVSSTLPELVFHKHFIDSLSFGLLGKEIDLNTRISFIDIGIGGGFPGIPLIIAFPEWKLCAIDSVGKKIKFLELLTEKLDINDRVKLLNTRAEDIAFDKDKREKFDLAVVRAVGKLAEIAEYALPFVKLDGHFVAYKAKDVNEESKQAGKALQIIGGKLEKIVPYTISDDEDTDRNLILIKKVKHTPDKYPRKSGTAKKNPII